MRMLVPPANGIWDFVSNEVGDVAYRASGGAQYELRVRKADGSSRVVAAHGSPAPGFDPPATFYSDYDFSPISLNNSGDIAFSGAVQVARGLWREQGGVLKRVAKSGSPAVDDPHHREFNHFWNPILNDGGQTLFYTDVLVNNPHPANEPGGIYLADAAGGLQRIVGPGDQLSTDRGTISALSANSYYFSATNDVIIEVGASGIGWMHLMKTPAGFRTLAAVGDAVGDEQIFFFRGGVQTANDGTTAYHAAMIEGDAIPNQTFAFIKDLPGEPPVVIARTESLAPDSGDEISALEGLRLNDIGQIAFSARLRDSGTDTAIGLGLWLEDLAGDLRLVAKSGQSIDVDPGLGIDLRTISSSAFTFGPLGFGIRELNDRGELLFSATFTDGTTGLFVVSHNGVPEPGTSFLSTMAAFVILRRRRNSGRSAASAR
jgi:hypothetical protein